MIPWGYAILAGIGGFVLGIWVMAGDDYEDRPDPFTRPPSPYPILKAGLEGTGKPPQEWHSTVHTGHRPDEKVT